MTLTLREDLREGVNGLPFQPVFSSQKRSEPANVTIVHVATRIAAKCPGTVSRDVRGMLAPTVGTLVFDGPGRGYQWLDETTPEHRQGPERLLALLMSRVLACLYS